MSPFARHVGMPNRFRLTSLIAIAAIVAACQASSEPSTATVPTGAALSIAPSVAPTAFPVPTVDPAWTERPIVNCGPGGPAFPSLLLDGPGTAETAPDPAAAALRALIAEPDAEEMPVPNAGWRRVLQTADQAIFLAPTGGDPGWFVAAFRSQGGQWSMDLEGPCSPKVSFPNGIGGAEWRLDPAAPPDQAATSVVVLANESACASGKPPDGRVLAPILAMGKEIVGITILVRLAPGGQDCPSNPEFRLTVPLPEPLGARSLYDASVFPPARR